MLAQRTECMPVLNDKGELVKVYFWESVFGKDEKIDQRKIDIPVAIMAGGKGTRLQPITNVLPKPLIPIGKKTIVEYIMDRFMIAGCNSFYLSVNYKAEMVKQYFNSFSNTYHIEYFQEEKPLGTAGSLSLLKEKIDSTFFVTNCDILIDQNLVELYDFHREHNNEITLVAAMKNIQIPYGTIITGENGHLISLTEKPDITLKINAGLYLLEPHLLKDIPEYQVFNITDLIQLVYNRKGKVGVFPVSEKSWIDIGEWDKYLSLINVII